MRFISALLAGALAVVAAAQTTGSQPNPFTNTEFTGIAAGSPFTITWTPTTQSTVTLELVHSDTGNSDDLKPVSTIKGAFNFLLPSLFPPYRVDLKWFAAEG